MDGYKFFIRWTKSSLSSGGPGSVILDTTLTGTISVLDEFHVSCVTPAGAPRVLHDPVVLAGGGIGTISDNEGSVIEAGSAATVENTTLVGLESEAFGINTNREGLNSSSGLHGSDVVRSGGTLGNGDQLGGFSFVVSASSSSSGVGVRRLGVGLGGTVHVVIVSPGGETSIAGFVLEELVVAIEELLLRERSKSISLDLPDTFEASSGRESPARTALTLILDGGNGSSSAPVDGGRGLNSLERWVSNVLLGSGLGSSEEFLVFGRGPGGHFVVSELVR